MRQATTTVEPESTDDAATVDLGLPDDLVTLEVLAKDLRRQLGNKINFSTVYRWCMSGVKGEDGLVHILPSELIGRRRYISPAAFRVWRERLNGKPKGPSSASGRNKRRDDEMADKAARALLSGPSKKRDKRK